MPLYVTPLTSIPESTDDTMIPATVSGGSVWGAVILAAEASSLRLDEETIEEVLALQATKFIPTTTTRKMRRAFFGRLNRIRTTLYDYLNIGSLP
jgi:hypothetical protein